MQHLSDEMKIAPPAHAKTSHLCRFQQVHSTFLHTFGRFLVWLCEAVGRFDYLLCRRRPTRGAIRTSACSKFQAFHTLNGTSWLWSVKVLRIHSATAASLTRRTGGRFVKSTLGHTHLTTRYDLESKRIDRGGGCQ